MRRAGTVVWKEIPFIRIIIPFCAGILFFFGVPDITPVSWFIIPAILIFLWRVQKLPALKAWNWRVVQGLALNLLIFMTGLILACHKNESLRRETGSKETGPQKIFLLAMLEEPAIEKKNRHRAVATIFEILPGLKKKERGKAIIYFPPGTKNLTLSYGTLLLINTRIRQMQQKGNPGRFDFASFYARQGIFYQLFLKEEEYSILPFNKGSSFTRQLFKLRDKIILIIQRFIPDKEASGLAEALLIGYRNDLDQRLMAAYTNTGVVHVIAISGLHLGLLFSVFMSLSGGESRKGKKKWIQLLIIIPLLWVFSLLAGGSASVIRSACMFTLIGIGRMTGKKGYPLNTLFATALLLLCYQPDWIFDIGFQLSFSAVGSILIYYPAIKNQLHFSNPIALKCRDMIAVTLSAQILTTPLILFYFNQFPILFLLTNLFAVPLSGWILLGEICLVIFHSRAELAIPMGSMLSKAISLMNDYVLRMDQIPFSVIRNVYLSLTEVFLLYLLTGCISCWIKSFSKPWFFMAMACVVLFSSARLYSNISLAKQHSLVVLQASGQQVILLVKGVSGWLLVRDDIPMGNLEKELLPVKQFFRLEKLQKKSLPAKNNLIFEWEGKRVLLLDTEPGPFKIQKNPPPDLCVLAQNPSLDLQKLYGQTQCQAWVADGTHSLWKIREWKKAAELLHLRFHSVTESGAFLHDFNRNGPAIYPSNPGFTPE